MLVRNDPRGELNGSHGVGVNSGGSLYGHLTHGAVHYNLQNNLYAQMQTAQYQAAQLAQKDPNNQMGINHAAIDNLAQAFSGVSLNSYGPNNGVKSNSSGMSTHLNGLPTTGAVPVNVPVYYQFDGRMYVANSTHAPVQQGVGAYSFAPGQAQYIPQFNYQTGQAMPNTPQPSVWSAGNFGTREIPELAGPRRNSYSSNEEAGPQTPFFGAICQGEFQAKVVGTDMSPQTWSTPSPQTLSQSCFPPQQLAKSPNGQYTYIDLDAICMKDPVIPKPIPAIFSGEKGRGTLEKSLHNATNTTNVYIRGLHPGTTDEMLHAYGARFGDIMSAKAMLDQDQNGPGLCKGFGFIKYHNFVDGENCIRGFFHWGYEAKWARVSHNEKLKTLGDVENTNLYVSNLPLSFNEHTLMAIFTDHEVLSAKILRDTNGLSRGVGFARFATPEICNQVIENYNGKPIGDGDEGSTLSIRFADTQAQKQLKNVTAERRQFKTNEYNTVVYGPSSPYQIHSNMAASFPSPLASRVPMGSAYWPQQLPLSSMYPTNFPGSYNVQTMPMAASMRNNSSENHPPTNGRYSSRIKIESPSAIALAKRGVQEKEPEKQSISTPVDSTDEEDAVFSSKHQGSLKCSPAKSGLSVSSPAKSSPSKSMASVRASKL